MSQSTHVLQIESAIKRDLVAHNEGEITCTEKIITVLNKCLEDEIVAILDTSRLQTSHFLSSFCKNSYSTPEAEVIIPALSINPQNNLGFVGNTKLFDSVANCVGLTELEQVGSRYYTLIKNCQEQASFHVQLMKVPNTDKSFHIPQTFYPDYRRSLY